MFKHVQTGVALGDQALPLGLDREGDSVRAHSQPPEWTPQTLPLGPRKPSQRVSGMVELELLLLGHEVLMTGSQRTWF